MSGTTQSTNNKYYYVLGGAFRTKVNQSTPNAIERVNKKGVTVYEIEHKAIFGFIEDVSIFDGEFGKQITIKLDPDEDGQIPVLSFNVESADGKDVLEKLPGLDFAKEVRIMPYRFTPEGESKEKSGISFHTKDQDGKYTVKLGNFFMTADKKPLHGYPTIDWDYSSETDRKIFFIKRNDFLLNYLQENILKSFSEKPSTPMEYPTEDINPENVAF